MEQERGGDRGRDSSAKEQLAVVLGLRIDCGWIRPAQDEAVCIRSAVAAPRNSAVPDEKGELPSMRDTG